MSKVLINPQPPAAEQAQVEEIFSQVEAHLGFLPDALRLYGISPPLLQTFVGTVSYFRGGTALPPALTTMIRYLVSAQADCRFCIDMNEGFLESMGISLEQARAARDDIEQAPLADKERVLLKLAVRAVDSTQVVQEAEIDAARDAGWSDRDIFDAVAQAASNRALNHVLRTFRLEQQGGLM